MSRYPKGRKQYNGRVERSFRTDDEELYRPFLMKIEDVDQFLSFAQSWQNFYNNDSTFAVTLLVKETDIR